MTEQSRTRIKLDDAQHRQLTAIKEKHGVSWRGMLYLGAQRLEAGPTPFLERQHTDQQHDP